MRTAYKNPENQTVSDGSETLSADERNRLLAEMTKKSLINERLEKAAAFEKGFQKGFQQGELVGRIHVAERSLKRPLTPEKKLFEQSLKNLRAILKQLKAELKV